MPQKAILVKAQTLLAMVPPTLFPTNLETGESVAVYNPQKVLRQLGYDHSVVMISGELATSSACLLKQSLLARALLGLAGMDRLFCLGLARCEPDSLPSPLLAEVCGDFVSFLQNKKEDQ